MRSAVNQTGLALAAVAKRKPWLARMQVMTLCYQIRLLARDPDHAAVRYAVMDSVTLLESQK